MKPLAVLVPAALTSLLCACIVTVGGSSCQETRIGSGHAAEEARGVAEFSRVTVGGAAELIATRGPTTSVVVRCDDNLIEFVETEVRDGALYVSLESGSYQFESGLEVEVVSPHLDAVTVSGAAKAKVSDVDVDHFEARVSGAGKLTVTGRADTVDARVSGAGKLDLGQLVARAGDVRVSGAGNLWVNAREKLSAQVSGAGGVQYSGSPDLSQQVSGAGSVTRK